MTTSWLWGWVAGKEQTPSLPPSLPSHALEYSKRVPRLLTVRREYEMRSRISQSDERDADATTADLI